MVETKGNNVLPYPCISEYNCFRFHFIVLGRIYLKKQPLPLRLMKFVIITVNQKRLNLDEEVCDWEINVIIFLRIYY